MGLKEEVIYLVVVFILSISAFAILSTSNSLFGFIGFMAVWGVYGFARITISIQCLG